ncbi:Hypothetical predicted protein [Octopus vulgaris]|uniref:Uncharacterized protein n=1 Tax=Octopus vulgaris TaxID=6645 RepID=A0AA36B3A8_OCTVU|nr:Hypothetical predicted protein [Octopus vulgaris]
MLDTTCEKMPSGEKESPLNMPLGKEFLEENTQTSQTLLQQPNCGISEKPYDVYRISLKDYSALVHCSLLECSSQNMTGAEVIGVISLLALNAHAATRLIMQESHL